MAVFTNLSINQAGGYTLLATDGSLTGAASTAFTITAAAANHFVVSAPGAATAGTPLTFTVTAEDPFNNTAAGYGGTIHFTSTNGIAVLPANSTLSGGAAPSPPRSRPPGARRSPHPTARSAPPATPSL